MSQRRNTDCCADIYLHILFAVQVCFSLSLKMAITQINGNAKLFHSREKNSEILLEVG
jgi:hypothetical protein